MFLRHVRFLSKVAWRPCVRARALCRRVWVLVRTIYKLLFQHCAFCFVCCVEKQENNIMGQMSSRKSSTSQKSQGISGTIRALGSACPRNIQEACAVSKTETEQIHHYSFRAYFCTTYDSHHSHGQAQPSFDCVTHGHYSEAIVVTTKPAGGTTAAKHTTATTVT